jgi:hypothetical protein
MPGFQAILWAEKRHSFEEKPDLLGQNRARPLIVNQMPGRQK